jgi:hypothetical protein
MRVQRPNDAGQWRAANGARLQTETRSARPLKQPGSALSCFLALSYEHHQSDQSNNRHNDCDGDRALIELKRPYQVGVGLDVRVHVAERPKAEPRRE